ncbi:MAG: chlorophyll synthesis pathway protein BchC [Hyphomonas sp.]
MKTGVIESQGAKPALPAPVWRSAARAGLNLIASAVTFDGQRTATLRTLSLVAPQADEVVVDVYWSGVSTGTERLMWSGEMPSFPGMGYPLVPGYEAVGRIVQSESAPDREGELVFVPGARCFEGAHGLFGASASRLVVPSAKAHRLDLETPQEGILLALAATAYHAVAGGRLPDLIIGHGVLGQLTARLVKSLGGNPVVWELDAARRSNADYAVIAPDQDTRRDYASICDMSGDSDIIDKVLPHAVHGAELCLAGFYSVRPSFGFPLAFRKEMRLRVAAEWRPSDLEAVIALTGEGRLSLSALITHVSPAAAAAKAYATAFSDPSCLKMILDWGSSDV